MFIILYDENRRVKKDIKKSYKYKGIEIFKEDKDYYFKLSYPYELKDNLKINKQKYIIENLENSNQIIIYVYENSKGINDFKVYPNVDITIGSNKNNTATNFDQYLLDKYLTIKDKRIFSNFDNILVNNKKYLEEKLKHGDVISCLGIEIYYYNDFLYINNFNLFFNIKPVRLKEKAYSFKNERVKIANYYKRNYSDIILKKLIPFNPPRKNNDKKLIYQIGPSISMSLGVFSIAGINIYNSYLSNGFTLSIVALAIMPITIMLSGILWPLLNRSYENKKYDKEYLASKKAYLSYLKDYEKESLKEINRFLNDENYYSFNTKDIEEKLFYVSKNSNSFLTINIGHYTKQLDFKYDLTNDLDINEELLSLSRKLSSIGNANLFIDLKKDKRVNIITKSKRYFLLRIILELAYKYSPDDLRIAVYTKDKEVIEIIYNLIHLFDGNTRLILDDLNDLNKLNSNKINTVLISDELVEVCDKNLAIIDVVEDQKDILKYSDVVIEDYGITSYFSGKQEIIFDLKKDNIDFDYYFKYLAKLDNKNLDHKTIRLLDSLYSIGDIENDYLNHDYNLKAGFSFSDSKLLEFDIHESKDGPHGLIGGSTGSGKSELIVSFLLSLVLKYPPNYLNIILIDYKGGGIKESLSYQNKVIPHIIASVNNLEEGTFERLIVAIDFELKRRQKLFKELSLLSSSSIMSIDDYLSIYKDYGLMSLAHILIVVDEFAELKKQNPEIIKELISFSRIGRSLGVHLILATQKPSGVIDEEIWSNSRFKIALKVHNEKDSEDIIKSKDAYYLKRPGEFYLKVDDTLRKAEAIYSKTDVNNKDKYEVAILNHQLNSTYKKTINNKKPVYESTYICSKIIEVTNKLSLLPIKMDYLKPSSVSLDNVINYENNISFGIIDDYLNAKKGILRYSFNENLLIYSNRKDEANNIIYQLNKLKRKMIVIGDRAINAEYICDFIEYDEEDNLHYLFNKLLNEKYDDVTIIIKDVNSLMSYDETYGDYLLKLTKRQKIINANFILLTTNSVINFKLLNNFKNKLAIEINDSQDLTNIFSKKSEAISSSYFFKDTPIPFVPCQIKAITNRNRVVESFLDAIPKNIMLDKKDNEFLIGYYLDSRKKAYLKYDESLLISSFNNELLKDVKKLLKGIKADIKLYEDDLVLNKYTNIIWLSDSIYSQRLFFPERNVELKDGEAYLYRNGKGRIIKLVNYEPNNNSFLYSV